MNQDHAFCLAIEKLTETAITRRASLIRVLFCEIGRILNHLLNVTTQAMDVGALTPPLWGFEEREKLMVFYERASGARLHAYLDSAALTYNLALRHFLYTTFSAPLNLVHRDIRTRLSRLVALLAANLQQHVGRNFADARLRQILSYPAVFLSSEPAAAPALHRLQRHPHRPADASRISPCRPS